MTMTITEALAEIKTIGKRLEKKKSFVQGYLWRQEGLKDPLVKEYVDSISAIKAERQAINDLQKRIIQIRTAIQKANETTTLIIGDQTQTMAEWLIWKREVAPAYQQFLIAIANKLHSMRSEVQRKGLSVVTSGDLAKTPQDIIVNIDEQALAQEIEKLEEVLGNLDGQLSLKNATVMVEV